MKPTYRSLIYEVIERSERSTLAHKLYNALMLTAITVSLIPLMFHAQPPLFRTIEVTTVAIFILDYLARWMTADLKLQRGWRSFLVYPFTFMAIIDLLSILPAFNVVGKAFKTVRVARIIKIIRVFRFARYLTQFQLLMQVLRKESNTLLTVLCMALSYIFITALIMFNAEDSFNSFFDALYWATTTLTTVGYGDIYPTTELGRFISMVSAIFGVAIIALPSGIITASYLDEIRKRKQAHEDKKNH